MSCHHEKRVHEDHHQHLLVQPRRGGPGHLAVRHAGGTLPHVEAVSLDSRRGINHTHVVLHANASLVRDLTLDCL